MTDATFPPPSLPGVPAQEALQRLGWNAWLTEALAATPRPEPQAWLARLTGDYGVEFEIHDGQRLWRAVSGSRRTTIVSEMARLPVTGDWAWCASIEDGRARIVQLLPRRRLLRRRAAGTQERPQHLVSHVDQLLVVVSLQRDLNLRRIERYLVLADDAGCAPVVVLTKRDMVPEWEEIAAQVRQRLGDVPVLPLSSPTGEGIDALRATLVPHGTVALLGSSGAGKSTLVNALCGEEIQLTGEVRASDDRGRHTTTARRIVWIESLQTSLVDTPGLREVDPGVEAARAHAAFQDLVEIAGGCRFRNCRHDGEPDCAVLEAIEDGTLSIGRLRAFHRLDAELRERAALRDNARSRR